MARTPFDTYAKDLTLAMLTPFGAAESDARISAEAQYADLRFVRAPRRGGDGIDDFLTRALAPRMLFEFAHHPPDVATVVSWLVKRDVWFLALRREARRRRQKGPTLPPTLCALTAGDPVEARVAWGMLTPTSPGCYDGPPSGTYKLIVINQLPVTRDTLLVRTMGGGATLRGALAELDALPLDARERTLAAPRIGQLRIALLGDPSPEAKEIVMQAQKIYDKLMQQQLNLGRKEGRQEGLAEGLRAAIADVCTARGLKLTTPQRARLAAEGDAATLRQWHARAVTVIRSAEVFTAG